MADAGLCAASTVAGCLVAPVNRLCGHVISYDSYVRKLNGEVEKLGDARDEVQHSIDEARNNTKPIKTKVEKWVREVQTVTNEARDVLEYDGIAKKTCFYGWLPNLNVRYRLGREARKKAECIQRLIDQKLSGEVYDDPPPGRVDGTPEEIGDRGDTTFDSRASILEDIMKALDHEKHKVVGIYGPGGVGKTTLLEEVEKKLRKEGRPFDMIVKSKVSQTPDLKNIQDDIAYALKLDLKNEPSEVGRRDRLFKRLQKDPSEKILIILDDLWKEFDLKEVGIPSGDESKGCKLLLTSRFKDVLEQMKCDTPIFHLEGLKDKEAFRLFEKTVGDRLKDDEELKAIAPKVVKKLAGLPLLIISVACCLKDRDVTAWRIALKKIDQSKMETIVKLSYDHLKSEDTKTLFLLCGLIGGTIDVEILLVLGMGLGLFEEFGSTIQDSRDGLNTMLDELRSVCLLLDGGDDKNNVTLYELLYDDDYKNDVTIHDLYSEVVVSTPFSGQNSLMMNSNYVSWSKEKLEKYWAICLADVDKRRFDELMKCQFPDKKILISSQPGGWRWKQEHEREVGDCSRPLDFTCMKEFCGLYFRSMHMASLPPSVGILGNLHSLYLDCCDVKDVAILGKLKALQILTVAARSTFSRLPKEIGELTNLRSLNLSKCYYLKTIAPGVLNRLTNLEELHIYHFSQWMGKDQMPLGSCARLAELKSLTKLASLEISISNPIILLEDGDLPFENLDKFRIKIGNARGWKYGGLPTMGLDLKGCDSILLRKWVKKNLQKTQYLYLTGCSDFKESPRELCTQEFQEVKRLHIGDSPSIKYIVDSSNDLPLTAFGKLESFSLDNLINLEKICHGPIVLECNKLKDVRVVQCNQLKYLWRLSDVQRLVRLEEINVSECSSMQSIVTHDAREDIVSTNNRVELPNVRRLRLHELPNMTSFCDTSIQVSLPHLESLIMIGFLDPEKILYSELSSTYSSLRSLLIRASKSTSKSILKLDWILKLSNLESMSLGRFPSAEVIFDLEELKVIEDVEICSRLTKLTLEDLPNLQCMWKQDVKLQGISIFRNLRDLFVYKTGLSFLFSVSVAKCFREIRVIRVWDCQNMKAVIVDEEGRNEWTYDIIEFPLLEHLSIRQCPMEKFFLYPHVKKEPVTTTSDLQDAYSNSFFDRKVTFPNITKLQIGGLLCQEIWNNQIPTDSFQKLESLVLTKCDNLQSISTSYMWKRSQRHLEILKVISCRSIKIIYEGDGTDIESGKLRSLVLCDLENLRCIWQSDKFPNVPFPNLRVVEAVRCPRLEMLFPTFTMKFLGQIKQLIVDSCEDMELIAGHEKGEEATHTTITFSELTLLMLVKLPKFRSSFLPEKYSLKFPCSEDFPSLQNLRVKSCGAEPDQVLGHLGVHQSGDIYSKSDQVIGQWEFASTERERGMPFHET